ncbi:hypothetical protein [Undibacterium sp. Tian12W]|uniref:hypothetical protein n=1 Tax=Undibacterium sp. Tian12W TaxID=3413054 RepID=UPI003BF232E7
MLLISNNNVAEQNSRFANFFCLKMGQGRRREWKVDLLQTTIAIKFFMTYQGLEKNWSADSTILMLLKQVEDKKPWQPLLAACQGI